MEGQAKVSEWSSLKGFYSGLTCKNPVFFQKSSLLPIAWPGDSIKQSLTMFLSTEVTINIVKLQIIIKIFVMNSFVRAVQLFEYDKRIPYSSTMYRMVLVLF